MHSRAYTTHTCMQKHRHEHTHRHTSSTQMHAHTHACTHMHTHRETDMYTKIYTSHRHTHAYTHTHISEMINLSLLKGLGSLYYVGLPFRYSRILNYTEHTRVYYSMWIKVEHALPNALRVRLTFFCLFVEALTPFGK